MILYAVLPDVVTPRHVATLRGWIRSRALRLRPWLETYAAAEGAREGVVVEEGAVPVIFDTVLQVLDQLAAKPTMDRAEYEADQRWFEEQAREP